MAETQQSLEDLKNLQGTGEVPADEGAAHQANEGAPREPVRDRLGRSYATGKRKDATARVWIKPGKGNVTVNGVSQKDYFGRETNLLVINQPFLVADRMSQFDVMCTVSGGGKSGQSGAIRHGISRALEAYEPELRLPLKKAGLLTRDDRMVERKKTGRRKARRSRQFSKR